MLKRKDTKLIVESWRNFINDAKFNDKKDVLEEGWKDKLIGLMLGAQALVPQQALAPNASTTDRPGVEAPKEAQKQLKNKLEEFAKSLDNIKDKSFEDPDGFGADTNTKEIIYDFIIGVKEAGSIKVAFKKYKNKKNAKQFLESINDNMRLFSSIREYMPGISKKLFNDEEILIFFVSAALAESAENLKYLKNFSLEKFIKNFKE